ncbi:unnamed protein product [Rotaria socialis]|uniref:Uncharacterized protein n=2 Tax=Rotaria socialis TaxID=392032 RepID=A0A819A529_9BILA|nr:unnamed protein product [Rotaria socialis]
MATASQISSHCFVQWEDNKNAYAVVHAKRAKTSLTLQVGLITLFEGNNRDRRRGKILYMGAKSDCTVFSFDFEQQDTHVNTYSWSLAPGISEHIEETAKAIKNFASGNLHRTAPSSSINSTTVSKGKKKVNNKQQHTTDNSTITNANMAPTSLPAPTPVIVLPGSTLSTITIDDDDQPSRCNDQQLSNTTNAHTNSTKTKKTAVSYDIDSLLQENNALREKINELEEQLMFQRETSIPFPNESSYNYLKGICSMYDQSQREENKKLVELSNKLPCSDIEIKLAKKSSPAATINNLIKCCFKDIELVEMSYEKLKTKDASLLKDIHELVNCLHAPTSISQSMFSGTISLKCRHLRENRKNETIPKAKSKKRYQSKCIDEESVKQHNQTIHENDFDDSEDDKENNGQF